MTTTVAFGFLPGGGFAIGSPATFDMAVPHQHISVPTTLARRTYRHIDYSPEAIALAAPGNWPSLRVAVRASPARPITKASSAQASVSRPISKAPPAQASSRASTSRPTTKAPPAQASAARPTSKASPVQAPASRPIVKASASRRVSKAAPAQASAVRASPAQASAFRPVPTVTPTQASATWPISKASLTQASTTRSSLKVTASASVVRPTSKASSTSAFADFSPALVQLDISTPISRWIATPEAPSKSRTKIRKDRKPGPYSKVTSHLNKRDAKPLPPGRRYRKTSAMPRSRTDPRHSRRVKSAVRPLTAVEIREGWQYPPRRHTTYPRRFKSLLAHFKCANRFAALASLSHAQRRQLEDTGVYSRPTTPPTPRLPHPRRERKRRAKMAAVHVVQVREEDHLRDTRRITRSLVATMPTPPRFYSLSHPATPQAVFTNSPVVTTYMTSGEEPEVPLSPRTAAQRIAELEAEVRRLKESTVTLDTNQGGLRTLLSGRVTANPEAGSSSGPQPMQIDAEALASSLQHLRMSEPNSPRIQLPAEIPIDPTPPEAAAVQKEMISQMIADCLRKQAPHLFGLSSMVFHKPYSA